MTSGLGELLSALPYCEHMGIRVERAADGEAVATLELGVEHSSVPGETVAHGGVPYALADTAGGAAVISLHHRPTPTVDMRIDYLAPAERDLRAEATVLRDGESVAVADVTVEDAAGTTVATARGVYKTAGGDGGSAWSAGAARVAGNGGAEPVPGDDPAGTADDG